MTATKFALWAVVGCAVAAIIGFEAREVFVQRQTVRQLEGKVAQAEQQTQSNEVGSQQSLEGEIDKLRAQNAAYASTMERMQRDVAKARASADAALQAKKTAIERAESAAKNGNAMVDMLKDPEMLKAMRPTQVATMKMMYGPLLKRLDLSPEQADKFYDLLVDNGLKSFQAMQAGTVDQEEINANQKALEADLKSVLGEAGYQQYADYTKNEMQDQSLLHQIKNDFQDNPLSDAQQTQLLQAMEAARQTVTGANPSDTLPADPGAAMSKAADQQEQINQIVLQNAASFLSPEQLQTLGASQSNIVAMERGMAPTMLRLMGKKAESTH